MGDFLTNNGFFVVITKSRGQVALKPTALSSGGEGARASCNTLWELIFSLSVAGKKFDPPKS